jgi:hypothetical protein
MPQSRDTTPPSTLTAASIEAIELAASAHYGLRLKHVPDGDDDQVNLNPAEIIEASRLWGAMRGRAYAHNADIYAAVKAGEEVDWLDDPDMLWDDLGFNLEDLRLEAEEAARESAKEVGEATVAELTPDQVE